MTNKITKEKLQQARQVAIEDIDNWDDYEIAEYLSIGCDEVNYQYRNDAIEKRTEEILKIWETI